MHKNKILIIKNDTFDVDSLKRTLEEDYAVLVMTDQDADLALQDSDTNSPSAVLIFSEQRDTLCEQFKKNKITAQIPVLYVAENFDEQEVARGIETGASDFLQKPFVNSAVKLRVQHHIALAQYQNQLDELLMQHKSRMKETLDVLYAQKDQDFRQAALVHTGRLASLGEMATSMAHEISQPLNIISIAMQGWQLMADRDILDQTKILKTIPSLLNNVERISFLIDHVRTLGHCTRENREINICDVLQNALSLCKKQFDNSGISINARIEDDLPPVFAVESEIEQVALNLLSNARCVLEMQKGSSGFDPKIVISCYSQGGMVYFDVEDNGGGINPAYEEKIFESFFSTKEPGKGTGLGLSICRQIMERYRGELTLHNMPGQGARFTVSLPASI